MICPCCRNKLELVDIIHDTNDIIDYYKCNECGCEVESGLAYCYATEDKEKLIYTQLEDYLKILAYKYGVKVACKCNLFNGDIYVVVDECQFLLNYTTKSLEEMKAEVLEEVLECVKGE